MTLWRRPKTLVVQGIKPRFPGHPACELSRLRVEFAVTLQITAAPLNLPLSDAIATRIATFYYANSVKIKVQVFWDMTLCQFLNISDSLTIITASYPTLFTNRHGVITQKSLIFISSALRTFNLAK